MYRASWHATGPETDRYKSSGGRVNVVLTVSQTYINGLIKYGNDSLEVR